VSEYINTLKNKPGGKNLPVFGTYIYVVSISPIYL
jgi:hypothetical protein